MCLIRVVKRNDFGLWASLILGKCERLTALQLPDENIDAVALCARAHDGDDGASKETDPSVTTSP